MKIVFVVGWAMFIMVMHFGNFVSHYFVRVTQDRHEDCLRCGMGNVSNGFCTLVTLSFIILCALQKKATSNKTLFTIFFGMTLFWNNEKLWIMDIAQDQQQCGKMLRMHYHLHTIEYYLL